MKLIKSSISRPKAVVMIFTSLILLGFISLNSLSREFLPEIEVPRIVINTVYPSGTPEDVREKITIPLESSLSSINGLKDIKSVSRSSVSTIELLLEWGVDMIESELQVRETIDSMYSQLPQEAMKPQVIPVDPNNETLMVIGFYSNKIPLSQLKRLIEDEVGIEVQKVEGVGSVNLIGGTEEEVNFLIKADELSNTGLSPKSLSQQFTDNHLRYPAGSFKSGDKEFLVVGDSNYKSLSELKDIKFYSSSGSMIPVSDLAESVIRLKDQKSAFYFNGIEGVGLEIKKRSGCSQDKVAEEVQKALANIAEQYKSSFKLELLYNKSVETKLIINSIIQSLLLGGIISFILLFLVTNRLLTASLLIISLPVSLLITFFAMRALNMSINLMSLGGIAIVLGMLVDNGVIVLENINRNYNKSIFISVSEVAKANFASTLTTLIVFVPLILLPGVIGVLYKELAITVSFALLSSYFVSITLLPGLYNLLNKSNSGYKPLGMFTSLNNIYNKSLKLFLRNRMIMPLSLLFIGLLTVICSFYIKVELVAPEDNSRVMFNIEMPSGSTMEYMKDECSYIYNTLNSTKYFKDIYFRIGAEPGDMDFYGNPKSSSTTIYGTLILKQGFNKHKKTLIERLQKILFNTKGDIKITDPEDSISKLLGNGNYKYNWLVTSDDMDQLDKVVMSLTEKEKFIEIYPKGKKKTFEAIPKREIISKSQLNPEVIFKFLRSHLSGVSSGSIIINDIPYDIRFINENSPYISIEELKQLYMPIGKDNKIRIQDYIDFKETIQSKLLYRSNKLDSIIISSDKEINFSDIKNKYNIELYSITSSLLKKKFNEIILIFSLAVIFIYLFLGAQFESFKIPFLLLITLPLSLLGVELLLILTKNSINLNSSLGILVLFGIVVNNSIVLKEKTDQLTSKGKSNNYAVLISAMERFLPILITTLTTVLSLLPIAFEIFGSNGQSGMAWVIIGGMVTSTFLTLYIVPSLSIRRVKNE